ncbi:hypothetical protein [Streptomyces spongiae]|uniref:Uncharacterized protein n=1 Tax=Streptomyces spongiae TaxID=565072 RepID=A0A5N8XVD8_9ACTN|nr:hypothetical protein [Streptomyces spongiae]MPY63334.1 hypothetical protein [Streptomyces spongiae]
MKRILESIKIAFWWMVNVRQFRWLALFDATLFVATAGIDIYRCGSTQVLTGLLRIIVGGVNAIAFWDMEKEYRDRRALGLRHPEIYAWEFPSAIVGQASAVPLLIVPFRIEFGGDGVHDVLDISIIAVSGLLLACAAFVTIGAVLANSRAMNLTWGIFVALLPALGLLQFWYMTFFKPAHERPRVDVTSELREVGRYGDITHMQGAVTLHNIGAGEVDVLDAVYTITGHDVPPNHQISNDQIKESLKERKRVSWAEGGNCKGLLKVGRLIRPGGHLTPGQRLRTSFVFDAMNDAQDKMRLTVFLSVITRGSGELEEFEPCRPKGDPMGGEILCRQVVLPDESLIRDELGDEPVARVYFREPSAGLPVHFLETQFVATGRSEVKGGESQLQKVDPYRRNRGFTTSVEYRVDP